MKKPTRSIKSICKFCRIKSIDCLKVASYIIAASSVITAITPTPVDDGVVAILHKILTVTALNIGEKDVIVKVNDFECNK